jgi:subtilase-type serine protease
MDLIMKKILALSVVSVVISGCGGGGGGGSSSLTNGNYRNTIIGDYQTEYNYQTMLSEVNPLSLNDYGYDGTGVRVAVVDSGIDAAHPEFDGRTIYGHDFASSASGYDDDENGHGTHVASIIAGDRDSSGMRGVAYDATLYSYKTDNDGDSGLEALSSDSNRGAVFDRHVTDNIQVSNNSWGGSTSVTAYSQGHSTVLSTYSATIAAAKSAQSNGTLIVFAAGNNVRSESDLIGALPYHDSDLAGAWLTVVAVDSNLKETRYTNRCGVAKSFCVTAPGGGDTQSSDGILAADANTTGYTRLSGTSMATPHVSGIAAALMEKFPNLTPAQIATRIKDGASLSSLTGYNGQTLAANGTSAMQDIFGYGLVNAQTSSASMGSLMYLNNGSLDKGLNIDSNKIPLSSGLSSGVINQIMNDEHVVFDSFDGANFTVKGRDIFTTEVSESSNVLIYDINKVENGSYKNNLFKNDDYALQPFHLSNPNSKDSISNDLFWKNKAHLIDSLPFSDNSAKKQLSFINTYDNFIVAPFVKISNNSDMQQTGLMLAGEVNDKSSYSVSLATGKQANNLGYLANYYVNQDVDELQIGLQADITSDGQIFASYSKARFGDISPTTSSFGFNNINAESLNLGFESSFENSVLTVGLEKDYLISSGSVSILSPSQLKSNGDAIYSLKNYKAKSNDKYNPYIAYAKKMDNSALTVGAKLDDSSDHMESLSLNYSYSF